MSIDVIIGKKRGAYQFIKSTEISVYELLNENIAQIKFVINERIGEYMKIKEIKQLYWWGAHLILRCRDK